MDDYFGDDKFLPINPEEYFRRRYRMSSTLFNKIVNNILSYDDEPIPEYFTYFRQRHDATGRLSIGLILKCTSAIRQLAYDTAPVAFDEYFQIAKRTSRECLDNFTKCIYVLYVEFLLRKPTATDIQKTLLFVVLMVTRMAMYLHSEVPLSSLVSLQLDSFLVGPDRYILDGEGAGLSRRKSSVSVNKFQKQSVQMAISTHFTYEW
ncbi:hypothetical protein Tco_1478155 [Tanacetum coccineum]